MDPTDPAAFWTKAKAVLRQAGEAVVLEATKAWYVAQDPATPTHAKAMLYGALTYFVLPTDAVPDALPIIGFSDDLAALSAALYATNTWITPGTLDQARASVRRLFG
ncbi:YkvA family protein [Belnapia rosea]|uniref:DUF1232 domain-containing protein n=1 Tax=Belnapia rosea TaxID=938405 RepID=A0A1G7AS95_9PROT|nr:DUF1232 domain-containing protein [Belnapia rosea]SDB73994.1 Protein of unknown function [Belnapia rosea]SDE17748.1 Protein of unknown function [Belnapia rosea]